MFTYLPLVAIIAVGLMAAARIIALRRRGIRVVVNDPQRLLAEKIFEASTMFLLIFWGYLLIDYADGRGPRWLPERLNRQLFDAMAAKWLGAVLLAAGVGFYALALKAMGDSWRMGIDRPAHDPNATESAANLITHGIFARSRNPIYFSFDLLFLGSFLVHGRVILLLTVAALALMLQVQIVREERFLAEAHRDAYAAYRRSVRRYL